MNHLLTHHEIAVVLRSREGNDRATKRLYFEMYPERCVSNHRAIVTLHRKLRETESFSRIRFTKVPIMYNNAMSEEVLNIFEQNARTSTNHQTNFFISSLRHLEYTE